MTLTVKVGHAKTHLSDLLAKLEAGEEVIIARGDVPIARLTGLGPAPAHARAIAAILAARQKRARTSVSEILAFRDEGRRS